MLTPQQADTAMMPSHISASSHLMCVVCTSEPRSAISKEGLCWVCRRLKNGAVLEIDDKLPKDE